METGRQLPSRYVFPVVQSSILIAPMKPNILSVPKIYFPVDGDRLEGLPRMEVMSREEYFNSMKALPKPGCYDVPAESIELISAPGSVSFVSKSLSTLRASRCRTCVMCLKDDCGKCQSCVENEKNTRPTKLLCLKKVRAILCHHSQKGSSPTSSTKIHSFYLTRCVFELQQTINAKQSILSSLNSRSSNFTLQHLRIFQYH